MRPTRHGAACAILARFRRAAPFVVAAIALVPVGAPAGAAPQNAVQAALSEWTSAHPATTALVWRLDRTGPVPVAAFRPDDPRMPASTMKVVTSAGALLTLGAGFRFETRLYAGARTARHGRVIDGPLYLKGYGDPILSTPDYARRFLGGLGGNLGRLVGPLRTQGVRLVRGPLVADETFFDEQRTGPAWKSSYVLECPPLSGLAVNQNYAGQWRSGNVANPPVAALGHLRQVMTALGMRQRGSLRVGRAPSGGRVVATVKSPPLRVILGVMNRNSDNFIAETLAKDVAAYAAHDGSSRRGTAVTGNLLRERGILGARDRLVDGSGLSRANRLSATSLVRLFASAVEQPWGRSLIESLAHTGEGTLRRRFLTDPAAGRVRAKTGYINGVSGLTGVVTSRRGVRYAFAFLMNDWNIAGAHATQDRVVTLLAAGAGDRAAPVLF